MADTGIVVGDPGAKKPWQSRTVIMNALLALLAAIAYFWPGAISVSNWINANSALIASIWGILNVGLRLITKDRISLSD